jgi:hypothetical protein
MTTIQWHIIVGYRRIPSSFSSFHYLSVMDGIVDVRLVDFSELGQKRLYFATVQRVTHQ